MNRLNLADAPPELPDDNACLEWLKNQRYPDGIFCPICKRVTKHSKSSKKRCYICNNCGDHVFPTSGTIFHKSSTPLKIWFDIIRSMLRTRGCISIKEIQRKYGVTYKTAWRMVYKIREYLRENGSKRPSTTIQNNEILISQPVNIDASINETVSTVSKERIKRDRIAGLLKLQMLLHQNPQGLSIDEIALRCSVSKRTVYRDLQTLESELNIPIWGEGGKRGISEGYFLPPINLSLKEACFIYLLIVASYHRNPAYDPNVVSTFFKLITLVPHSLKTQSNIILKHMETLPRYRNMINNFKIIMEAFVSRHKIKIVYQDKDEEKPMERIIEPYLVLEECLIAFCNLKNTIRAFRISDIIGNIRIELDTFEIPDDFDAIDYLESAWGTCLDDEIVDVKLRFDPKLIQDISRTQLHPSQIINKNEDTGVITLKVRMSLDFRNWILSWGNQVKVLEPQTLRDQIREEIKSMLNIYS